MLFINSNMLLVGGGVIHDVPVGETPLHPAWRKGGLASVALGVSWAFGANTTMVDYVKATLTNQTQVLAQLIGEGSGVYFNEADP
jgi:hypothetical protein